MCFDFNTPNLGRRSFPLLRLSARLLFLLLLSSRGRVSHFYCFSGATVPRSTTSPQSPRSRTFRLVSILYLNIPLHTAIYGNLQFSPQDCKHCRRPPRQRDTVLPCLEILILALFHFQRLTRFITRSPNKVLTKRSRGADCSCPNSNESNAPEKFIAFSTLFGCH